MPSWDTDTGLTPLSRPPQNLAGMRAKDAVDAIIQWFFENFEDPVHHTTYNGPEGGYLYIWGPYNAQEILEETFGGVAPGDLVRMAIDMIAGEGTEWVPAISRVVPPDENEDWSPPMSTAEAHAEIQREIRNLQDRIAQVESALAGIGHNQPPEPIEDQALSRDEVRELKGALTALGTQPVEPPDNGAAATVANQTLTSTRDKIRRWLGQVRDGAIKAAINTAVSESVKAIGLRLWPLIEQGLTRIIEVVSRWIYMLL